MEDMNVNEEQEYEGVGNSPSVSQNPTLDKIDKVKHYIRIRPITTLP